MQELGHFVCGRLLRQGFRVVQFQALGQTRSCVQPVDANVRSGLNGDALARFRLLLRTGSRLESPLVSRSRLNGLLHWHCPRQAPRIRRRLPPRFSGGSRTPEELLLNRHCRRRRHDPVPRQMLAQRVRRPGTPPRRKIPRSEQYCVRLRSALFRAATNRIPGQRAASHNASESAASFLCCSTNGSAQVCEAEATATPTL